MGLSAEVKQCPACGVTMSVSLFSRHKRRPDGLQARCKGCAKALRKPNTEATRLHNSAYRRLQTGIRRDLVAKAKSVPCTDCKVVYP